MALKNDKKDVPAGWDEIWSKARYHATHYPYIGIDEASMRATAFVWCRRDDRNADINGMVDHVIRKVEQVKNSCPIGRHEVWDWEKERQKVGKQLERWSEKWDQIQVAQEKIAKEARRIERERRKKQKEQQAAGEAHGIAGKS